MTRYLIYYIDEMGEPVVMPYESLNQSYIQLLNLSDCGKLKDNDTAEVYNTSADLASVLDQGRVSLFSLHTNLYIQKI